jgi:uncharacterized surface protein with fasciclin (FAS1) repeats
MTFHRLLTAAAAVSLIAGAAAAQTPATATTEKAAQAATGKATSDAPAKTAVQGTARAVGEAAANVQATTAGPASLKPNGDIMTTLRTSGQFSTFVKALDATNLGGLLQKQPNITVFAPTDAAFATAFPGGQLDQMMGSDAGKQQLQKLLIYHLINARIDSAKIKGARGPVPAGSGDKIVLDGSAEGGPLKAENATIIQSDVACSNGLIQVVDQVMKPGSVPEANPEPQPAAEAAPAPAPEPEKPAAKPAAKRKK